ncbi:hemin uptake protein HemP [Solimicrobium silvestre]|uniref:Hemin uptake protein hemP n=1 Tax=Solimicrobium silvestre TaxID=2099400 RepID=A0A2S9H0X6_9BURK|nr:hemin uptake protein HemP [Solimicrobium silvestre]PRC93618.1 Hemin uptake protein hemP [Solimicrobium silvestre]
MIPLKQPVPASQQETKDAKKTEKVETLRILSKDIMRNLRELEIDHEGRIYRLRITQLNKLILTA